MYKRFRIYITKRRAICLLKSECKVMSKLMPNHLRNMAEGSISNKGSEQVNHELIFTINNIHQIAEHNQEVAQHS